jgi:hypothetical protein
MGATLTGSMSCYKSTQGGSCDFYSSGRAVGRVFWKSYDLGSVSSNITINSRSKNTRAWGYLKAGSKTILPWDKSMTGTADFTTAPQKVKLTAGLDLGPVDVGAGISIELKATGKINCSLDSSGRSVVTATFGPSVDVAAFGYGNVNILIASGGLKGQVSLCKMALNSYVQMTPLNNPAQPFSSNVVYSQSVRMETLSGKLTAWWDTPATFWDSKTWTWNGFATTKLLGTESFTLKGGPIVQLN